MQITPARIAQLNAGFSLAFQKSLKGGQPWWNKIARKVPSKTKSEVYGWQELAFVLREWVGSRHVKNMEGYVVELVNKDFEGTIGVNKNEIADDILGIFRQQNDQIIRLGRGAAKHPDRLVLDVLLNGQNGGAVYETYDGQAFFSANHPIAIYGDGPSGVQSNYTTATDLSTTTYDAAVARFMAQVDHKGDPLGLMPDALIVGPYWRAESKKIVKADTIAQVVTGEGVAAVSNTNAGEVELIIIPEITGKEWFLAKLGVEEERAIVYQERLAPEFTYMTSPTDEGVFMTRELRFGVEMRGAAKGVIWQTLHKYVGV